MDIFLNGKWLFKVFYLGCIAELSWTVDDRINQVLQVLAALQGDYVIAKFRKIAFFLEYFDYVRIIIRPARFQVSGGIICELQ